MIIFFFLLLFLVSIAFSIIFYSLKYGISPMPSTFKAQQAILSAIPVDITGNILELGSGWGSLAFPMAKKFPACRIQAYEISPIPWMFSLFIQRLIGYKNLVIKRENFFYLSFQQASVIVCYLYPQAMIRLKNKFEKELIPGTIVISHTFAIPGWTPFKQIRLNDLYHTLIYIYKI
jgi:hypothetical protein